MTPRPVLYVAVYQPGGIAYYDEIEDPLRLFPLAPAEVPWYVRQAAEDTAPDWWPGPRP